MVLTLPIEPKAGQIWAWCPTYDNRRMKYKLYKTLYNRWRLIRQKDGCAKIAFGGKNEFTTEQLYNVLQEFEYEGVELKQDELIETILDETISFVAKEVDKTIEKELNNLNTILKNTDLNDLERLDYYNGVRVGLLCAKNKIQTSLIQEIKNK